MRATVKILLLFESASRLPPPFISYMLLLQISQCLEVKTTTMKVRLLQKAHKKKTNVFLNLSLIIYTTSSDSSSTFCDAVHSRQIFDYFKVVQ